MNLTATARGIFLETLRQLTVAEAMRNRVHCSGEELHVGELIYPLQGFRRIVIVAMGKAAGSMCEALLHVIEPALLHGQMVDGLVIAPTGPTQLDSRLRYLHGSHPFPDHHSRVAAEAVLNLLGSCDESCLVLFLISGGASAMVEKPLDSKFQMEDAAIFHRALVQSGLPITQMNALRKHFSQVKGGRLAVAAQGATQCTLLISDVPAGSLHIVGSGPSLPDPSTVRECRQIIDSSPLAHTLPRKLLAFFRDPELEETPKADHPAFEKAGWLALLSSDDLCDRARNLAIRAGFHVVIDNTCDDWDYREAAVYLLNRTRELHRQHARVCLLSAGEISVELPAKHGVGGRNQQFVLECARLIAEGDLAVTVLSGGSDGVDGNSAAAGAIADETTFSRAASRGLDAMEKLEQFDSFAIFDALGDAIITGPTGNNVRDLRIFLCDE